MDKKTALKILKLEPSVSFEEAKKAYRELVKQFHPDVAKKKTGQKVASDVEIKQINIAFRYLSPLLKSVEAAKKKKGEKKDDRAEKSHSNTFLSQIFRKWFARLRRKKNNSPFRDNHKRRKSPGKTNRRPVRFDDVLNHVYQTKTGNDKKNRRSGKKTYSKKKGSYDNFQKYMALKRKLKSRQPRSDQDISVGRVEKISPVRPVKPVRGS